MDRIRPKSKNSPAALGGDSLYTACLELVRSRVEAKALGVRGKRFRSGSSRGASSSPAKRVTSVASGLGFGLVMHDQSLMSRVEETSTYAIYAVYAVYANGG